MTFRRLSLLGMLLFPCLCPAVDKNILSLQRDVANLQDQLNKLQRTLDDRLVELSTLIKQNIDFTNKTGKSVEFLESSMRERLMAQDKLVAAPIANLGAKVDQMAGEFQGLKETVADLSARMGKIQQQLADLNNAVKTLPAPTPPPPGTAASPQIPAETLYQNALRDRSGGKADLALQEFNDYLKYYGNTDLAPNAQFQVGEIYYSQQDWESALKAFDLVLEKYPENNKTPDALYMKAQSLIKMGKRTQGVRELQELIRRYRNKDLAKKAQEQLRSMGMTTGSASRRAR
jgi:tol-pal system protein YbgF